jgi:hypothetical protein
MNLPFIALERIEVGAQIDAFIGEVQLVSRHAAVLFNGVNGDVEQAGNLFTGQAVFHHIADLDLAGSQFYSAVCYFTTEGGGKVFEGLA